MAKMVANFTATVGCIPCLVLPFSVVNEHLSSDSVSVQGPNGKDYTVKVVKRQDNIYLVDGWTSVEEENSLKQGDILFFKLFEGSKLCFEILENMMIQNIGYGEKADSENRMIENMGSGERVDLSYEKKNTRQNVKKKRVSFQEPKNNARCETNGKQNVRGKEKKRARSEEDNLAKKKATGDKRAEDIKVEVEAAKERLSNPSAIIEFTKARIKYPQCPLPRPFASKVQAENGSIVDVIVPGCKIKGVKWVSLPTYKGFGAGWSKFRRVHKIQEGDWALLELTVENTIIIHMHRRSCPSSSTPLLSSWSSSSSDEEDLCDEDDVSEEPKNSNQEPVNSSPSSLEKPANSNPSSSSNSGPSYSSSDEQKICKESSDEKCNDKVPKQSLKSPKRETRSSFKWKVQEYSKMFKKPFVYVEITKSRLGDECLIEKSFIHEHLGDLKEGEHVTLKCLYDCTHKLGWNFTGAFSEGWPDFITEHHLRQGDELLLELLDSRTFKVHLFRI